MALVLASAAVAPSSRALAQAQAPSFTASADPSQVALDEAFVYEVTLTFAGGDLESYQAPDFKDLRVLSQTPRPSSQMQMSWGGGRNFVQHTYTWRYELAPLRKGNVVIGPARARLDGRELRTGGVTVSVSAAGAAPPLPPPASFSGGGPGAAGGSFLRVAPDKVKVYVGEQVTVGWFLYITQRMDKYQTLGEPRIDAFWTEDLPIPNMRQGLSLTQEMLGGRTYEVAPVLKKALFPLQPGATVIGPMEAEIAQVDFFGASVRSQRVKSDPVTIEALPLPTAGRPRGFDAANVGRYSIGATVDRATVAVGEAVTVKLEIRGQGNVRNLRPPTLGAPDGWKLYEPRVSVTIDPGDIISGAKTVEYLMLPERVGITTLAAFELAAFDPQSRTYKVERSAPLRIEVTGGAGVAVGAGASAPSGPGTRTGTTSPRAGSSAAPGGAGSPGGAPVENVLPAEIRPIHARPSLRRDIGAALYRSPFFFGVVAAPPVAYVLVVLVSRLRERLGKDTARRRRRRVRRLVRQRLGAAEAHMGAGRPVPFFIEMDRVLRDSLSVRLGRPVTGLRMDELRALLLERSMPPELTDRLLAELEACDQGRFAPGSLPVDALGAVLDRAGELILVVEKTPLRDEARP